MAVSEAPGVSGLSRRGALRLATTGLAAVGGLVLVPSAPPALAATFTDVATNPFRSDIEWMASTGISTGWSDGTFRPHQPVARDAMAAFVHRFAGAPATGWFHAFTDVPRSQQFSAEMAWMKAQGIAWGWIDGTYRPLANIQRDAMAAFLFRLLDARLRQHGVHIDVGSVPQFPDISSGQLFAHEIRWMRAAGITTGWGDGTFRPLDPVVRHDMAAFLHRAAALADRAR